MITVKQLFKELSEFPDEVMIFAEAGFAKQMQASKDAYNKMKILESEGETTALSTWDWESAKQHKLDLISNLNEAYFSIISISELVYLAKTLYCHNENSYQKGYEKLFNG